jgi:putative hydrolase of the HAD superfamily
MERVIELDDHGYGSKPALYARIVTEFGLDAALALRLEAHFWKTYDRCCEPSPETLAVLSALRESGTTLGVITNGTVDRQQAKLRALGLADVFDVVLISEAEGLRKPDARIFHRAAGRLGVVPPHAMFVGDHPEVDVAGAHAAGLQAVWKRVPYWPLTCDVPAIDSLRELLPLVEAANRRASPP